MFSVVFTKTAVTQLFAIQSTNCTKGYLMHLLVMHDKSLTTEALEFELLAVQRKPSVM